MEKFDFKDLNDGYKLKTLDGKELTAYVDNAIVSVDGAVIQNGDVKTSNGVMHILDSVLKN